MNPVARLEELELLATRNATLRLRAPSGHVFSFTDLTSAGGLANFGHLNPAMDTPNDIPADLALGFYPPAAAAHAAWLCESLGLQAHSVLYRPGQQAALNAAIALAQHARPGKALTIEGSTHGLAPLHLRENSVLRIRPGADFTAWPDVACLLYEPMQTDAGYLPLPLPWLRGLSQAAQAAGVPVIADETHAGFFRFGKLSLAASEYLRPDLFVFGNSMTNGVYPLFAVVYPRTLPAAGHAAAGQGSAFQTAALGFTAAEAVARYIDSNDLDERVAGINRILNRAGETLAANPCLTAFHLAGPTLSLEVRDARAPELAQACQAAGVLVGLSAPHCPVGLSGLASPSELGGPGSVTPPRRILIAPPLTIPKDQLRTALKAIEAAAAAL